MRAPSQVRHGLFLNEATLVWTQPENWTHFEHDCSGWIMWMETGTKCQRTFIYSLLECRMIRNRYKRQPLSLKMAKEKWRVTREKRRCGIHQIAAQRKEGLGKDALSDTKWLTSQHPSLQAATHLSAGDAHQQKAPLICEQMVYADLLEWNLSDNSSLARKISCCAYSHCIQAACSRNWSVNETPTLTLLVFDRFCVHADVFYFEIQTSCDGKRSSTDICWDVPTLNAGHHLFVLSAEIE